MSGGLKLDWFVSEPYPDGRDLFRAEVGKVGQVRVHHERDGLWRASSHIGPFGTFARLTQPTRELAQEKAEDLAVTALRRLKRQVDEAARIFAPKKKGGGR